MCGRSSPTSSRSLAPRSATSGEPTTMVVETLLATKLLEDDRRFDSRGPGRRSARPCAAPGRQKHHVFSLQRDEQCSQRGPRTYSGYCGECCDELLVWQTTQLLHVQAGHSASSRSVPIFRYERPACRKPLGSASNSAGDMMTARKSADTLECPPSGRD